MTMSTHKSEHQYCQNTISTIFDHPSFDFYSICNCVHLIVNRNCLNAQKNMRLVLVCTNIALKGHLKARILHSRMRDILNFQLHFIQTIKPLVCILFQKVAVSPSPCASLNTTFCLCSPYYITYFYRYVFKSSDFFFAN